MSEAEIIELDCRKFWKSGRTPPEVMGDMERCNLVWVSSPKLRRDPTTSVEWVWEWKTWKWRQGPCIPPSAQFERYVEVRGEDQILGSLREMAHQAMLEEMRILSEGVEMALFLCIREKYRQGLLLEEKESVASLLKVFVLLGKGPDA